LNWSQLLRTVFRRSAMEEIVITTFDIMDNLRVPCCGRGENGRRSLGALLFSRWENGTKNKGGGKGKSQSKISKSRV
jgi:hypothetical protein